MAGAGTIDTGRREGERERGYRCRRDRYGDLVAIAACLKEATLSARSSSRVGLPSSYASNATLATGLPILMSLVRSAGVPRTTASQVTAFMLSSSSMSWLSE